MKKIVVTGGSGGAGRFVVRDLIDHGYQVRNLDLVAPTSEDCPFVAVDMTDYGAVFAAFHGYDAVVHLAANPQPDFDFVTGADRFKGNTVSTYNAFQAAVALGDGAGRLGVQRNGARLPVRKRAPGQRPCRRNPRAKTAEQLRPCQRSCASIWPSR